MLKIIDWFSRNWQPLVALLGFLFLFKMIIPIKSASKEVGDGFKEFLTTKSGFIIGIILILFFLWILTQFKGMFS